MKFNVASEVGVEVSGSGVNVKWHVWFASHCLSRRLSTWQMIATSCLTALGALCGQLMLQLAWCCEHSAVTVRELLQLLDFACGSLLPGQLRNPDITYELFRRQLKGHLFYQA